MSENMTNINETNSETMGNIKISPDVVATIANMATSEIKGVAGMHSSIAVGLVDMLSSKKQSKGVKVEINEEENSVIIDLSVTVDYGVRIPELAWEIQENVKNNVENMTGLTTEKVNIHIEGVRFEKAKKKLEELPEPAEEIIIDETPIETIPVDADEVE